MAYFTGRRSHTVSPTTTTTYNVTGTDVNGCENTAEVTITVNPLPTIIASANNNAICIGESTILTGSGASSYTWNPGGSGENIEVSPTITTTYVVTGIDVNGCENTAEVTITVNPLPIITIDATDLEILTFAKGVTSGYLPLGGVFVSDRVADVLIEKGGEFFHGYTYSGHPVACAVAIANVRLIQRENLVERIRDDIGPYLQQKWQALGEHELVGDTRMVGLMGAFEIVQSKEPLQRFDEKRGAGALVRDTLMELGICMRAVGDTIICAPPFILSHAEADELIEKAWQALDQTRQVLST